ncbi:hypothetical protein D3C76_1857110 [compost metagenome]
MPLRQGEWARVDEQLRQGLAWIFTHHIVQVLALAGRVYLGEVTSGDPTQEPFFEQ